MLAQNFNRQKKVYKESETVITHYFNQFAVSCL